MRHMESPTQELKKSGWIAIAGRPNAGKSTLLNRVVGTPLSIVSPKAQTSRENVKGIIHDPGLGQMILMDTPGIHKAKEGGINEYMMGQVNQALEAPDLIWYMLSPGFSLEAEKVVLERIKGVSGTKVPVWLILNKVDVLFDGLSGAGKGLKDKSVEEELSAVVAPLSALAQSLGLHFQRQLFISAKSGLGVDELIQESWEAMPVGPAYYTDPDQLTDRPMRFFASEIVREQLFLQLEDEIPYSCAVKIETYEDQPKIVRLEATIFVERDSQLKIVVGKGGQKIKNIGVAARKNLESWVEKQVFLGLKVKVNKDWTSEKSKLAWIGYRHGNN